MRVQWKNERLGVGYAPVELKVLGDGEPEGTFEAHVAMFNTPDRPDWFGDSDVIDPGAFTQTLQLKGMPPIVWSHEWGIPPIGVPIKAIEDEIGLYIKARLFLEDDGISGQYAKSVRTGMTSSPPVVREFSFAFEAQEWSHEKTETGQFIRHLKRVELFEVGPVLIGRHPDTELIGAKSHGGPPRATPTPSVDAEAVHRQMLKSSPAYARAVWEQALVKAGARNSTEDKERLGDIFDKAGEIQELARTNGADR